MFEESLKTPFLQSKVNYGDLPGDIEVGPDEVNEDGHGDQQHQAGPAQTRPH